jgi:hypothetical protein
MSYRNMESTERFTIRAQQSTEKMERSTINVEKITTSMKVIALKTESETVFMRIITVITLFFLPGTFVSVCLDIEAPLVHLLTLSTQTLMSTDILRFPSENGSPPRRSYSSKALEYYLAITLPIMALTVIGSIIFLKYDKRKTARKRIPVQGFNEIV